MDALRIDKTLDAGGWRLVRGRAPRASGFIAEPQKEKVMTRTLIRERQLRLICISLVVAPMIIVSPFVPAKAESASPIYGVTIPNGYRQWELIAPALEAAPLNELRAVLGNSVATKAYRDKALPFPDGTILVKLAWKKVQSAEFGPASVPGAPTTVQIMVKDSAKYAATGGWGFGRFIDGKPADEAQHRTCFACHEALVKGHDFVFTRLAP